MSSAALARIVAHLDFDGSRVGSFGTSLREDKTKELFLETLQVTGKSAGRETRYRIEVPFFANEAQCGHEANAGGSDVYHRCRALHEQAHEVVPLDRPAGLVSEQHAPELLLDALRCLAPDALAAVEQIGLDFVVAELKLPTFVVKRNDCFGRVPS